MGLCVTYFQFFPSFAVEDREDNIVFEENQVNLYCMHSLENLVESSGMP